METKTTIRITETIRTVEIVVEKFGPKSIGRALAPRSWAVLDEILEDDRRRELAARTVKLAA